MLSIYTLLLKACYWRVAWMFIWESWESHPRVIREAKGKKWGEVEHCCSNLDK